MSCQFTIAPFPPLLPKVAMWDAVAKAGSQFRNPNIVARERAREIERECVYERERFRERESERERVRVCVCVRERERESE